MVLIMKIEFEKKMKTTVFIYEYTRFIKRGKMNLGKYFYL